MKWANFLKVTKLPKLTQRAFKGWINAEDILYKNSAYTKHDKIVYQ